jgi:hypothetical protein
MKKPSELPVSETSMTRRDVLKGAVGMATLGGQRRRKRGTDIGA